MTQFSNLVGAIYDCGQDALAWDHVLTEVAEYCGAGNAALVMVDPRIRLSQVITPRADPRVVQEYGAFWWQHDPTAAATAGIAPGVVTDLSATGRELYLASPFQNEFWARSGLGAERLASNLFSDGEAFWSLVLQTTPDRDEITAPMRSRFAALVPHFLRAATIQQRLHQLEAERLRSAHSRCDGVILLDHKTRPVWIDDGARSILTRGRGLRLTGNRLDLGTPEATQRLAARIHACLNPHRARAADTTPLQHGDDDDRLIITALPLSGATLAPAITGAVVSGARIALVLELPRRQQERIARRLRTEYGLTQAEVRVAMEIARGDGRDAAAARLGLSVNTVRTHLVSIFDKMGVRRQAELIRAILRS